MKYKEYITSKKEGKVVAYTTEEIKIGENELEEKLVTHAFVMDSLRIITGRVLTIIDAVIADPQQNKSTKDLVRNVVSDELERTGVLLFNQDKVLKQAEESFANLPDDVEPEPVDVFEALAIESKD